MNWLKKRKKLCEVTLVLVKGHEGVETNRVGGGTLFWNDDGLAAAVWARAS